MCIVMRFTRFSNLITLYYKVMTSSSNVSLVPVGVRGMKVLDREKFSRNLCVPILKVSEDKLSKITPMCKSYLLKLEKFKPVQDYSCSDNRLYKKCMYLDPQKINHWNDLPTETKTKLEQHGVGKTNFDTKDVELCYDNWKFDTIFKAVLPEDGEIVSSFSQIGHIIHLNLRDHLLEYRSLIGQVLLDKVKTCRTVVNKCNSIDNTYRNFSMELLAGDEDFLVTVKENRCTFQFDFSKVYWNPRLGKEHERILSFLKPDDVLFDAFCGVGPFSVPAAKRKCKVFANDLNPDSYKWLNFNADTNKLNKALFTSYNLDGKDFICTVFKDYLTKLCHDEKVDSDIKIHVTMNLPAMAVEFVQYFKGLLSVEEKNRLKCEIIVYVYCFAVGDEPERVARQMLSDNMQIDMSPYILDIFDVRNVSPKKEMMRLTFKLTEDILIDDNLTSEPPTKKLCVDNTENIS